MNDVTKFTPHETLELHELLNSGVLGVKKLNATMGMVQDEELKQFMQTTLNTKKASVNDIQATVSKIQNV
ncbi:hypothetical protein CSC2_21560 [Clostridium zeae]|uniref:Spore coat protein n=1 Tax=Clostridium zeae TaxID=2759022 RepID=A0ABQ1EA26_9CLOT|nr:hypothetical protein [Clostridium zeae]GFZ31630.1 hypothetical protein CSC2_21560 [Clostridium zeae]